MEQGDTYQTIEDAAEAIYKEKSSKFLCYAYPVSELEQVKPLLDALRKKYYDATHHCYAYRIGQRGELTRANDDGEPSSTAGKPILGQILSHDLTNILIVVIRYFGGTKLGVSGLISAYGDSAKGVIDESRIKLCTINKSFDISFSYVQMNDIMKVIKELSPKIEHQIFDNLCSMTLSIRLNKADELEAKIKDFIVTKGDV